MLAAVLVSAITAAGTVAAAWVTSGRRTRRTVVEAADRHTNEHGTVVEALDRLDAKLDRLDAKVDRLDRTVHNHDERLDEVEHRADERGTAA